MSLFSTRRSRHSPGSLLPFLLAIVPVLVQGQAPAPSPVSAPVKVEALFAENCAACHGPTLEGGLGPNLVDGIWKYGGTDEDIARDILKGHPEFGMPSFEAKLPPEKIRALVIFIREREREAAKRAAARPRPEEGKLIQTAQQAYKIETVIPEGLSTPWSLAFLPDGRKLVTEKRGTLRFIDKDWKLLPEPVQNTPPVNSAGQGGLLEVTPHPDFEKNGWIYLALSDPGPQGDKPTGMTAIVRGRIKDGRWEDQEVIFKADPKFYTPMGHHYGTRMVFDQGYLYFVVGERGGNMQAQDLTRPNGKIYRVFDDGRIPPDNPFVSREGAIPGIWSYGHRNPQGLALDPRDHSLYSTEHGPRGGDEFNLIRKGLNYGWPVICYGMNYDGTPITALTEKEGMEQPLKYWVPSPALCGLTCYTGDKFPNWKFDFFAGSLKAQELRRLRVESGKPVAEEIILSGIGRIRDVRTGPDGFLYLVLNEPDRIIRLVPAE